MGVAASIQDKGDGWIIWVWANPHIWEALPSFDQLINWQIISALQNTKCSPTTLAKTVNVVFPRMCHPSIAALRLLGALGLKLRAGIESHHIGFTGRGPISASSFSVGPSKPPKAVGLHPGKPVTYISAGHIAIIGGNLTCNYSRYSILFPLCCGLKWNTAVPWKQRRLSLNSQYHKLCHLDKRPSVWVTPNLAMNGLAKKRKLY